MYIIQVTTKAGRAYPLEVLEDKDKALKMTKEVAEKEGTPLSIKFSGKLFAASISDGGRVECFQLEDSEAKIFKDFSKMKED